MSSSRTLKIALAGCGTVGGELVRTLRAGESWLQAQHGVQVVLTRVLVRDVTRARGVRLPAGVLTADLAEFLSAEADVVVEAIGGLEPAAAIAASARARGLPFVTANKTLIAARGESLNAETGRFGLWFEAAVAGGVPVVRVLRDYLSTGAVRRVRGVLNGTCNYVLTRIERGDSFGVALDEARRRGFAEADCTRDLDGRDAADKVAILAWLAFGTVPAELNIEVRGILPDPERLVRGASAASARVRLLAECSVESARVAARVEPVVVPADSPFGRTTDEENRVLIETGWPWPIELAGPGAGGAPTAAALLADILQATTSSAPARPGLARTQTPAAEFSAGVTAATPRPFLLGVSGRSARELRVLLAGEGVSAEVVGASAGDVWLVTSPIRRAVLDALLARPDASGDPLRPRGSRFERPQLPSDADVLMVPIDDGVVAAVSPPTANGRASRLSASPAGVA